MLGNHHHHHHHHHRHIDPAPRTHTHTHKKTQTHTHTFIILFLPDRPPLALLPAPLLRNPAASQLQRGLQQWPPHRTKWPPCGSEWALNGSEWAPSELPYSRGPKSSSTFQLHIIQPTATTPSIVDTQCDKPSLRCKVSLNIKLVCRQCHLTMNVMICFNKVTMRTKPRYGNPMLREDDPPPLPHLMQHSPYNARHTNTSPRFQNHDDDNDKIISIIFVFSICDFDHRCYCY